MRNFRRPNRKLSTPPRGVTLLELLIVLTIMLMVTAAAIPIMLPAVQNRRMREASRLVSSYITGARARAIETGRPVGVMFERFNGLPFSMNLSYVEVPQPYAGDTVNSRILVTAGGQVTSFVSGDTQWNGLLHVGDLLKLDFKGPLYFLVSGSSALPQGSVLTAPPWQLLTPTGPPTLPANYSGANGVAFQIFRQPVRSSAAPMQLPEGAVIDLASSGLGSGTFNTGTPTSPIVAYNPVVTFSPNGSVDYVGVPQLQRPNNPIFFLLGRRDLMPDASKTGTNENLYDPTTLQHLQNFWISIGYQTGHVSVTEQAVNAGSVSAARAFAQTVQSTGGR
jgi:prepilin-type N-terminal cleavage/methylation domain-containing protein